MSRFLGRYSSLILGRPQPVTALPQPLEVPDSVHFINKVLTIGRGLASATLHIRHIATTDKQTDRRTGASDRGEGEVAAELALRTHQEFL